MEENPKRKVIYGRRSLAEFPEWDKSDKLIQKVVTYPKGTIESSSAEYHIDFAFEIIGGGVLAWVLYLRMSVITSGKCTRRALVLNETRMFGRNANAS